MKEEDLKEARIFKGEIRYKVIIQAKWSGKVIIAKLYSEEVKW